MILTLWITILIEGAIAAGYSLWHGKPLVLILLTSIFANILTQSLLCIGLILFFQHYRVILFIAEILIWGIESMLLYRIRKNQLDLKESASLSLMMNLASFGLGCFLPM